MTAADTEPRSKLPRKKYERELARLQDELAKLQASVRENGQKVAVLFEGRDAAGKGGVITRITQRTSSRIVRVVALPKPTDRERTQWYFQRYVPHLPSGGEIVLFDRSWYNRAGVERVMGFVDEADYRDFLSTVPEFEASLVRSGMILIKYWFQITEQEQERRFQDRNADARTRWKLSPIDIAARDRWIEYTEARDVMFEHTHTEVAPWSVVDSNDKRRARLNCISHLLSRVPYDDAAPPPYELPPRPTRDGWVDPPIDAALSIPDRY